MSEENNKDKMDVFDLLGLSYELRMKRWDDPTLTKEERGEFPELEEINQKIYEL